MALLSDLPILRETIQRSGKQCSIDDWSYETWAAIIPEVGTRENCAYLMVKRLLASRNQKALPQAVLSSDDTAARGVIIALHEEGWRVGRDLQMITAANLGSPVLLPYAGSIIQVAFDPVEIVAALFRMLEALMSGQKPVENPVRIAPHLIESPCAG